MVLLGIATHIGEGKYRNRDTIGVRARFPSGRARAVRVVRVFTRRSDETKPPAHDGPDQALLLAAVVQGLTRRVDAACERRFRYDAAVPYHLEKVVPVHNPVPVPYQIEQQVKDLWFDRNERAVATKLAAVTVQGLVFEPEDYIRNSPQCPAFRTDRANSQYFHKDRATPWQSVRGATERS